MSEAKKVTIGVVSGVLSIAVLFALVLMIVGKGDEPAPHPQVILAQQPKPVPPKPAPVQCASSAATQVKTVNQVQPSEQCQIEAAKLLKDWSTWLVTVQAAVLGLITIFFGKDQALQRNKWSFGMVISFALSIFFATFVLGSLPSIVQRITPKKELHSVDLFPGIPVQLWVATFGQHVMFLAGVICLAVYLITFRATGERMDTAKP